MTRVNAREVLQRRTRPTLRRMPTDPAPAPADPAQRLLRFFRFEHLPEGPLRSTSEVFCAMATQIVATVPACPERTVGLRKLLEAKDCCVRACLPPEGD